MITLGTQPRRVAAQSVAKRVAEEFGCRLGRDEYNPVNPDDNPNNHCICSRNITHIMLIFTLMITRIACMLLRSRDWLYYSIRRHDFPRYRD